MIKFTIGFVVAVITISASFALREPYRPDFNSEFGAFKCDEMRAACKNAY